MICRVFQKPRRDSWFLWQSSPCHFLQPFWYFPKPPTPSPKLLLISSYHNSRKCAILHFSLNARPANSKGFTGEPWIKTWGRDWNQRRRHQFLTGDVFEEWYQHCDLLCGVQSGIGEETTWRSTHPIYFSWTCWLWFLLELLILKASRNRATPVNY